MIKWKLLVVLSLLALVIGCSTTKSSHYDTSQATSVDLKNANYRVIKSSAVGRDSGFRLFGIQLASPSYVDAMNDLRSQAPMENRATAVANVVQEESKLWFLFFSIPRVTITGDIIEFVKTGDTQ